MRIATEFISSPRLMYHDPQFGKHCHGLLAARSLVLCESLGLFVSFPSPSIHVQLKNKAVG